MIDLKMNANYGKEKAAPQVQYVGSKTTNTSFCSVGAIPNELFIRTYKSAKFPT
jgi:hypothetical protein